MNLKHVLFVCAAISMLQTHTLYTSPEQDFINDAYWGRTQDLLDKMSSGININAQDSDGRTALQWAARKGYYCIVVELIALGANLNTQDKYGKTALMEAAYNGLEDIVIALLYAGAHVNLQDIRGHTALYHTIHWGHTNIARLLLKAGTYIGGTAGSAALEQAVYYGHINIVKLLLAYNVPLTQQAMFNAKYHPALLHCLQQVR